MAIDIRTDVTRTLPSSGGETTVELSVTPTRKTRPTTRHVALLLDTSGSMAGQKLANATRGAKQAVRELDDGDYVGIVGFDSSTETVLSMTEWDSTRQGGVEAAISEMSAGGGTDIYKGLEAVRERLLESTPDDTRAVKRIILLSDGQDRFDPSTYRDLAADYDDDGISVMAAGVGGDYDAEVMLALANASGGTPADLSEDDIAAFLGTTVGETDRVVAPNPTLDVAPATGFVVRDSPAYLDLPKTERRPIDTDGAVATLGLPELRVDTTVRLTFQMLGQPKSAGLSYEMATLRLQDRTGRELASATVDVEYVSEGGIRSVRPEKHRRATKVTADIQDPAVSDAEVEAEIAEIAARGWSETAADLEAKLTAADEDGGIIRIGKPDEDD